MIRRLRAWFSGLNQPFDSTIREMENEQDLTVSSELEDVVEEELLIEEISIDGMCGVY